MSEPAPAIIAPPSAGANPPPDWASLGDEIACPLCGYNLRGLTDARCPECGYTFAWSKLLDPASRKHPYLFEQHPEQNVRSFVRTAVGGLRPKRFWTSLAPVQTFFPMRLVGYWLVATTIGMLALLGASFYGVTRDAIANARQPYFTYSTFAAPAGRPGVFDAWLRWTEPATVRIAGMLAVWPLVTFLALMIFQISMRRAGILKTHVFRTVLYSSDFLMWFGLLALLPAGLALITQLEFKTSPVEVPVWLFVWSLIGCWLVMAYRLQVAYRHYLRFDHPLATVVAAQLVAALAVITAISLFF